MLKLKLRDLLLAIIDERSLSERNESISLHFSRVCGALLAGDGLFHITIINHIVV